MALFIGLTEVVDLRIYCVRIENGGPVINLSTGVRRPARRRAPRVVLAIFKVNSLSPWLLVTITSAAVRLRLARVFVVRLVPRFITPLVSLVVFPAFLVFLLRLLRSEHRHIKFFSDILQNCSKRGLSLGRRGPHIEYFVGEEASRSNHSSELGHSFLQFKHLVVSDFSEETHEVLQTSLHGVGIDGAFISVESTYMDNVRVHLVVSNRKYNLLHQL